MTLYDEFSIIHLLDHFYRFQSLRPYYLRGDTGTIKVVVVVVDQKMIELTKWHQKSTD